MIPEKPINGVEPERSEDDVQSEELGPRGVPEGKPGDDDAAAGEEDAEGRRSRTFA